MTIKVGVLGAGGRMGRTVCDAVESDHDLELVVRIDTSPGEGIETSIDALSAAGADVVVDFTQPASVMDNVRACIAQGVHCVVGTTGFSESDFDELRTLLDGAKANVFIAPNFSIGAVLMMHFSKEAARYLGSVEITEQHHTGKLDAPSGTATKTARDIAEVWKQRGRPPGGEAHPDELETITGARGADADGIHIHAMRVLGRLAHQEVVFGGPGENLTIRHDTMDRTSFMPGVLLAVRAVSSRPGLTIGLDQLLDLE